MTESTINIIFNVIFETYIYIYIYIHIDTYMYKYTCIHTYIQEKKYIYIYKYIVIKEKNNKSFKVKIFRHTYFFKGPGTRIHFFEMYLKFN